MLRQSLFAIGLAVSLVAALPAAPMAQAASAASGASTAPQPPDYRLGSGDKVRIITYGEESLTGEFFVSGAGVVSLPLIGEVRAAGLSAGELQRAIETSLKDGYLREPRVSVEVLTYRPFYILGEVNKPGEYPYTNGLTIQNAVATAAGYTYRANTKKVFIKRVNETREQEYPLTSTTPVAPGDTIRIGERFF